LEISETSIRLITQCYKYRDSFDYFMRINENFISWRIETGIEWICPEEIGRDVDISQRGITIDWENVNRRGYKKNTRP